MRSKTSYEQLKDDIEEIFVIIVSLAVFFGHIALALIWFLLLAAIPLGILYLIFS